MKIDETTKILARKVIIEESSDPKLLIGYDPESDTLSLWNGTPANYGETVAEHLTAESDGGGKVTGITLENAAALLRPYLFPESDPDPATASAAIAGE